MIRQSAETDARVYAYGCDTPIAGLDAAHDEARRQVEFWNVLVSIDRAHECRLREEAEGALPALVDVRGELRRLDAEIADTIRERRAVRADARKRVPTPQMDGRLGDLRAQERAAHQEQWRLMREWRRLNKNVVQSLEARRRSEIADARRASGLYWGNYNRTLDDFETARKTTRKKGRSLDRKGADIAESGVLTVQIQRTRSGLGASPEEIMTGAVSAVRITPITDHAAKCALPRGQRTRAVRTTVTMRADAAGGTITLPVWLHRPLPEACRVKSVQLAWKREGERVRWRLCLTTASPAETIWHPAETACGVDLGWRLQEDGSLRVATVHGSDGEGMVYALPARWMSGMDRVAILAARLSELSVELAETAREHPDWPVVVHNAVAGWGPGMSASRIDAQAVHDAIRAEPRAAWPDALRAWYTLYRRAALERDNLRGKLLRHRRELYRLWAREIAGHYSVIGLEEMDLSRMARVKKRDDDPELFAAARSQRQRAAVHILRSEIIDQARKHGAEVAMCSGKTTMQCGECGKATEQADRSDLVWTCEHCGSRWDQDRNAAGNLVFLAVSQHVREAAE